MEPGGRAGTTWWVCFLDSIQAPSTVSQHEISPDSLVEEVECEQRQHAGAEPSPGSHYMVAVCTRTGFGDTGHWRRMADQHVAGGELPGFGRLQLPDYHLARWIQGESGEFR